MENKEFSFKGLRANGFVMLFITLAMTVFLPAYLIAAGIHDNIQTCWLVAGIVLFLLAMFFWNGFIKLEPNEAAAFLFFGKYRGTYAETGYHWVNPLLTKKRVSLRARNLNPEPIKVNDRNGNPILIGMVIVWKLDNVYKALFEIDSQSLAVNGRVTQSADTTSLVVAKRMNAFEEFVKVQSDAALRQVAGLYAYDTLGDEKDGMTLRSGGEEINQQLADKLNQRLAMAGITVVEARINYLAYAPEIAAVMLRRQQAEAIIAAREKIVEGAVSMVKIALDKLSDEEIIELDDDKKAAMVSNLLVVLCGDEQAQPVVNTGTLHK
jgi:regulator of protease activity HflC (stomatin/prohibitin superfamily)